MNAAQDKHDWPYPILRIEQAGAGWSFRLRLCKGRPDFERVSRSFSTLQDALDAGYAMMDGNKSKAIVDVEFHYRRRRVKLYGDQTGLWRYDVQAFPSNHHVISPQGWNAIEDAYQAAIVREDELLLEDLPRRRIRQRNILVLFVVAGVVLSGLAIALIADATATLWVILFSAFVAFTLWAGASLAMMAYWVFHPAEWREFQDRRGQWTWTIVRGASLGCIVLAILGAWQALWFIPGGWGKYDEDGDWIATRDSIALVVGLVLGCVVIAMAARLLDRNRK